MEVTQREYALRLGRIVNRILENPECWDQTEWHYGTTHCIMGHAQIDAGKEPNSSMAFYDGMEWLGLSIEDANWLSASGRKLPEIYAFATASLAGIAYFGPSGYDPNGYDRDGYDREGYNKIGYNRQGYDSSGYDRQGYDRQGYDMEGYGWDGYDRDGYNRQGYDKNGYNRGGRGLPMFNLA